MVYFDEKYAEIEYDELHQIVKVIYKGYMNSEQYRNVQLKALECTEKFKATKSLFDCRKFITVRAEDQEWSNEVCTPWVARLGIKKIAGILPEKLVQKQVLTKMADESIKATSTDEQFFGSLEEALAWLIK